MFTDVTDIIYVPGIAESVLSNSRVIARQTNNSIFTCIRVIILARNGLYYKSKTTSTLPEMYISI